MAHRLRLVILALLIIVIATPESGIAASIWLEPDRGNEVRLEWVSTALEGWSDYDYTSTVLFLSGNFVAGKKARINVDVPYTYFSYDGFESSSSIGNPYLGVDLGPTGSGFMADMGLRLPLVSDHGYAAQFGALSDPIGRFEAFLPDILSVVVGGTYSIVESDGFGFRMRMAPVVWIDTGDRLDDGSEMFLLYSAQGFYRAPSVTFGVGFAGRYAATSDSDGDFGQKSLHELDVYSNLVFGRWMPSVRFTIPLDEDMKDTLDFSFVLGLGISLN